jgi:PAS domain S-box-containing protein
MLAWAQESMVVDENDRATGHFASLLRPFEGVVRRRQMIRDNDGAAQYASQAPGANVEAQPGTPGPVHSGAAPAMGLSFFAQVSKTVSSVSELSFLVARIMQMTEKALKASASSLLLIDHEKQEMFFEFADGPVGSLLKEVRFGIQSGIAGWVARHGEPAIVNDAANDARFYVDVDKFTGFSTKSILCAPLKVRGRTIGVIEALNKRDGSPFNEEDLDILTSVASTAAIAIALKQAEEALRSSELHYSTLLRSLTDAVIEFKEGAVAWCNDRVEGLYGYSKDALVGKGLDFFFPTEGRNPRFANEIAAEIEERGTASRAGEFQTADGHRTHVEYSFSRMAGGDPLDIVAVARAMAPRDEATSE